MFDEIFLSRRLLVVKDFFTGLDALCDLTFQDIKKLLKNWLFDKKAVEKLAVEILAVDKLALKY